jgi:tellurite resistance protein TerC
MLDGAPIAYWIGFHLVVLVLIVVDLAVLGRAKSAWQTQHNFLFVLLLLALATCFGLWIGHVEGRQSRA